MWACCLLEGLWKSQRSVDNYVREGVRDYTEITHGGVLAWGRFGKASKALVELYGWTQVRPAWRHFLHITELRFATPEHFARTYPKWVVKHTSAEPIRTTKFVVEWPPEAVRGTLLQVPLDDPRPAV